MSRPKNNLIWVTHHTKRINQAGTGHYKNGRRKAVGLLHPGPPRGVTHEGITDSKVYLGRLHNITLALARRFIGGLQITGRLGCSLRLPAGSVALVTVRCISDDVTVTRTNLNRPVGFCLSDCAKNLLRDVHLTGRRRCCHCCHCSIEVTTKN